VRVLIVDDHHSVRRGIRALLLLGVAGIDICGEAEDGRDAITTTRRLQPDVVIMDVRMPGINGLDATREIRQSSPSVQVIILSQDNSARTREEARKAGAVDYVPKSSIWTRLLPALRNIQQSDALDRSFEPGIEEKSSPAEPPRLAPGIALRDAEQRFVATFEQTAVGMAHVAEDGRWLRVNQKLCDLVGFSKSEMQQLKFQDLMNPTDLATDLAQKTKIATGEVDHYVMEERYVGRDGTMVPVRLNVDAVRDSEGNLRYYACVMEDTTTKILAEKRLAEMRRELQIANGHLDLLSQQLRAPLTRCSRDLRYLWVNQHYADLLERPNDEIIGRPILDVIGTEAFRKLQPRFEQVLTGTDIQYSDTIDYAGIGKRSITAAYRPTVDASGIPDGWVAFVQDMTGPDKV